MPGLPAAEIRALAAFRYELRRFLRGSEEAARAAGLEPRQHQLLLAVQGVPRGERPTIVHVAERLQLRHQSTVGLVDRLARRGLLRRRRDPADHRRVLLSLTRRGHLLLGRLSRIHRDELRARGALLVQALRSIVGPRMGR